MYPADPSGDPEEVWNCRCSMRDHIVGFRRPDGSISYVEGERDATMHSEQIFDEKARRFLEGETIKPKEDESVIKPKGDQDAHDRIIARAKGNNIAYREVNELSEALTDKQIIEKLAGGDETKGSCASLALSYCGNKVGLDVTDFRGGASQEMFSRGGWKEAMLTANANIQKTYVAKEATGVAKTIKDIEPKFVFIKIRNLNTLHGANKRFLRKPSLSPQKKKEI